MRTPPRGTSRCLVALALLACGCAGLAHPPPQSRSAGALPVADPTLRGTTQAQALPIGDTEEVVVRMGRDPAGNLVVQQVLSPTLSPEQQEELRRAFAVGDWKRKAPAPTPTGSWIETLEKNKP